MLKSLRRKFIVITMSLVGLVLVGVLGMSLYSTVRSMNSELTEDLAHALEFGADSKPTVGGSVQSPGNDGMGNSDRFPGSRMVVYVVDIDADGTILQSNNASVAISDDTLDKVVSDVLSSDGDSGSIPSSNLTWRRKVTSSGIRIAIGDTTSIHTVVSAQVLNAAVTILVAMSILFVIVWFLSKWAFEPVVESWNRQRRFVADASHELKTPLAVILANLQILERSKSERPAADQRWIDSTAEEAERMNGLVKDLLELARTDENSVGDKGGAFQATDVDLSSIADTVSLQFDAVAFEHGCGLETDIAEDVHVTGDPILLERLVKSLIENACKYAESGTDVLVALERSGSHARFSVTNQGVPIDPEDLPHIFDRFYRSDKARSRETGGFGLGLAIAKGIVDAHHGKIWATSTAEAGTCFSFEI